MKVRRYGEGDRDAMARMLSLAFGEGEAWSRDYYNPNKNPRIDLTGVYVIEEDGEARASATVLPLEVFVDGEPVPMGGVAAVFAHPAYRRRGYARKLMRTVLEDLQEREVHLSMLWPFSHPFYRKYGWELAGESVRYALNPRQLPTSGEQQNVRAFRPDDLQAVVRVFEERAARHQLCVRRSEGRWRQVVSNSREPSATGLQIAVHERDGKVEGYILYRMSDAGEGREPERTITASELVCRTNGAWEALISFLGALDPETFEVRYASPRAQPLHPYLPDSHVKARLEPEFMLRLVNVEGALKYLQSETPLVLEVSDDNLPENSGEYTVGDRKVYRGAGAKLRARLDVRRLAQLYAGYLPARQLAERGLIRPDSEEALVLLEDLFPARDPWVFPADHF